MKVTIKRWEGVATWKWTVDDDNCGICRMPFDGCCPDCKFPGDDCPVVWGECSHCFHMHCIMKWLDTQPDTHQCPMCRQEWKFSTNVKSPSSASNPTAAVPVNVPAPNSTTNEN